MSCFGLADATVAVVVRAVGEGDGDGSAAGDDVVGGQDRAVVGHDDAGAELVAGPDGTTDGATRW